MSLWAELKRRTVIRVALGWFLVEVASLSFEAFEAPANDRSVAVLPFVNMSGDEDNEYFADGITEELLNLLADIDGLRVPSRTPSFAFMGRNMAIGKSPVSWTSPTCWRGARANSSLAWWKPAPCRPWPRHPTTRRSGDWSCSRSWSRSIRTAARRGSGTPSS